MDRATELALGDVVLRMAQEGPAPADGPATVIDASVYNDAARHRAELRAIAARPVPAVHGSELPEPGSFVTLELGGVPLLVVRGRDGVVRALHNACAHRGATVEHRPAGTARALSCGFHGWSYELDGALRSVSDAALFSTSPCGRGLRPVGCEERHGIVWITANPATDATDATGGAGPSGAVGVAEWLGEELDAVFTHLGLADMVFHTSTDYELACNWKLLTDGFLELYHLKYLHRTTIAPFFPANLTVGLHWGDHLATAIPKNRLLRQLASVARDEWELLKDLSLPVVLMPATVLQWQAGHIELFSLRPHPVDPGRTTCRLSLLVPKDRAAECELWDRNWERVCTTIPGEDFTVAEEVQRNIAAGVVQELQIGRNEQLLLDHLAAVDRLIAAVDATPPG